MKFALKRRHLLGAVAAVVIVPPVARIAILKSRDNPLPPISDPKVVFADGWLLDASDLDVDGLS
ncbi:hypothetical protein [Ruegeria lacuscaerulensis]|uniref:hypothetical protein n=1 Tax=Ruegeria lacuscaerulensis TaxID=55218 RepID=UPI00147C7B5C|nr:hypothetical protein [Ruegeria lacuscaerulensis]